jgi:hypothetical protein
MNKNRLLNALLLSGLLIVTSFAARKSTAAAWEAVADEAPPEEDMQHTVSFQEAASWAVLSGAIVGLTRVAVRRWLATHRTIPKSLGKHDERVASFL